MENNRPSSTKAWFKRFLAGMMIGVGGILPGVSGSVLAVAFGLYKSILDALAGLIRDTRRSARFLLPVGLGGALGLWGVSLLLRGAMTRFETPLVFLFCGLTVGSLPSLVRETRAACGGFKKRWFIAAAVGFALSVLMMRAGGESASASVGPAEAAMAGAMLAAGSLLPGVSVSFFLMRLGWYAPLMDALSGLDIPLLVFTGLGAAAAGAALIGLVRALLRRFTGWTYALACGLMFGAALAALPRVPLEAASLLYLLPLLIGAAAAVLTARASEV